MMGVSLHLAEEGGVVAMPGHRRSDNDERCIISRKRRRRGVLLLASAAILTSTVDGYLSSCSLSNPSQYQECRPFGRNLHSLQSTSSAAVSSGHHDHADDHGSQSLFNVGYDAKSIISYYDQRPWEVGLRLNMLGLPLLGWYFGLLTDRALKIDGKESTQRKRGAELREHLVRSRSVAWIKSGQALSLRPDLLKSKILAEELGKLVDSVGSFPDVDAFAIMKDELRDMYPKVKRAKKLESSSATRSSGKRTRLSRLVESDPLLSMFEFYNDARSVASASIGQVYKARIRRGPVLEAAIGKEAAKHWGGMTVAIKIQRPDVAASAALDMYLIRRTSMWLSKFRGGDVVGELILRNSDMRIDSQCVNVSNRRYVRTAVVWGA